MVDPKHFIGAKWEVRPNPNSLPKLGVVTYGGKYGITITTTDGYTYPYSTIHGSSTGPFKFHSYATNPVTNQPYTLAEFQHDYPEYFI